MSDFTPGFAARHDAAAAALVQAFPLPAFVAGAHFAPPPAPVADPTPRHFSPADPGGTNPTAGWDPLDPTPDATPFVDPLEAARSAGYEEGVAAALHQSAANAARDLALVDGIAAQLGAAGRIDRAAMAQRLRQTVMLLVTRLVGEIGVMPDLLATRIDAAVDLLADTSESALLRVHPDDVVLLEGRLPATVFAAGDAALARGSFVLESASTLVEDGPALWLDQLATAIDRVPVPASC